MDECTPLVAGISTTNVIVEPPGDEDLLDIQVGPTIQCLPLHKSVF